MPLGYFLRNCNVDLSNSASRNNPMCIFILKNYVHIQLEYPVMKVEPAKPE